MPGYKETGPNDNGASTVWRKSKTIKNMTAEKRYARVYLLERRLTVIREMDLK